MSEEDASRLVPVRAVIESADAPEEPPSDPMAVAAEVMSGNSSPQTPKRRGSSGLPDGCPSSRSGLMAEREGSSMASDSYAVSRAAG